MSLSPKQRIYLARQENEEGVRNASGTFADFVAARTKRSAWVREPGLLIYVRRRLAGDGYVIANVAATTPGKGALTRFLDRVEPEHTLVFENLLNPRLGPYLAKRGYVPDLCELSPSYTREKR